MARTRNNEAKDRLGRSDWIHAGLQALAEGGVSNVRVEVLAKQLSVTKGSFYWHFVDRGELLSAMLESWRTERTLAIGDLIKRKASDARGRLAFLLKLSTDAESESIPGGRVENAIREWAKTSDIARIALSRVDKERLTILSSHYEALGFRPKAARARAFLFLSYVVGANVLLRDLSEAMGEEQDECRSILLSSI
jgi:AcrR family transcriptional regulator